MNAGLSNLRTLKSHLLPQSWETENELDDLIADLGLGVAAMMEEYCGGRKFRRVVDDTFEQAADSRLVQLPRFPVEGTPTLAVRSAGESTWEDEDDAFDQVAEASGLLYLSVQLGTDRDRVRVTYTGGYWWDETEDNSDTLPAEATALPAALKLAWLQQCKHVFAQSEALFRRAVSEAQAKPEVASVELLPSVKQALRPFSIFAA